MSATSAAIPIPEREQITAVPRSWWRSLYTPEDRSSSDYMVQLDGLRALAVTAVMLAHFCPEYWLPRMEPIGPLGVRLFFVLSGFLITGILLRARSRMDATGQTAWSVIKWFYQRRVLRIFPLFYAVLLLTAIVNISPVRETFWWHAFYASNIYFARLGEWHGRVSHLWSLAVEEQFYIVWPLFILCLPIRVHLPVILSTIAIGPLWRWFSLQSGYTDVTATVLTPACLDTLGMGALLAYIWHRRAQDLLRPALTGTLLYVSIPVLIFLTGDRILHFSTPLSIIFADTATGIACFVLVHNAAMGVRNGLGRFLSSSSMQYLGQISYSIYIVHNFMPHILKPLAHALGLPWATPVAWPAQTAALLIASVIAAAITWNFIEKPFDAMKKNIRFPAAKPRNVLSRAVAARSVRT